LETLQVEVSDYPQGGQVNLCVDASRFGRLVSEMVTDFLQRQTLRQKMLRAGVPKRVWAVVE
jgi:hypothetical protein